MFGGDRMKVRVLFLGLLLVLCPTASADEPFRFPEATHGKGELKYRNDVPVLVVQGSPEEMGEQIGVLGIKPVAAKLGALVKGTIHSRVGKIGWTLVTTACNGLYSNFAPEYRKELEAMAKAGGVEREILVVANCIGDVQHLGACSALVVEPSRSSTGGLLLGRNMDTAVVGDLVEASLVIVRRPTGKHAFVSVAFPGLMMCGSEMNDAGLVIAGNDAIATRDGSPKLEPRGMPMLVMGRRLMEDCGSLAEADRRLRDYKSTATGCAILADRKSGAVYEVTPKNVIVRRAEDGICICTNHFCSPELAVPPLQCWRFDKLEAYRKHVKLGVADVAKALHEVNQDRATIHSMIFEPGALRVHLSMGPGPATRLPRKVLECELLFK
jgi:hypothetical protein